MQSEVDLADPWISSELLSPKRVFFCDFSLSNSVSAIAHGLRCGVAGRHCSSMKCLQRSESAEPGNTSSVCPVCEGHCLALTKGARLRACWGSTALFCCLSTVFPRRIKIALETVLVLLQKALRTGAWPAQLYVVLHQRQSCLVIWWAWDDQGSSRCLVSPWDFAMASLALLVRVMFFFLYMCSFRFGVCVNEFCVSAFQQTVRFGVMLFRY